MVSLQQRKTKSAPDESMGKHISPVPELYGTPANRQGILPRSSLAQLGIERMVSVMGLSPQNLLIGFELSDSVAGQFRKFEKTVRRCRLELSGEAVHDARVQCRRLIARLVLIDVAMTSTDLQAAQKPLKRLLKSLGGLRDVQVQKGALSAELTRHPEVGGLWIELGRRQQGLIRSASRFVSEFNMGKLRRRLEMIQAELKNPAARLAAKAVLGDSIIRATQQAFDKVVLRSRAIRPDEVSTVHRVRTAYKKFRYMAESLPPTVGSPSEAQFSAMDGYQQVMGSIQDVEVLLEFLTGYIALRPEVAWSLASFKNILLERRTRLVRDYMSLADRLHSFWPLQSVPDKIRRPAVFS
jgi:CHAD domain-containing protein